MQHVPSEPKHYRVAEQAARQGDHATAYRLMCQALIENPAFVPAWLSMSKLVDDPTRQRECLERALALDPSNEVARDAIETLRLKDLLASVCAPVLIEHTPAPRQIGAYLVEQQLISQAQLQEALIEQRRRRSGDAIQLGDLLIERRWITSNVLARALVAQLQERIQRRTGSAPRFLGEYLIVENIITSAQLEAALDEQIRLRLQGQRVPLGNLLVRKQFLTARVLQKVLDDQRAAFYSQMGD
ncbi:MAG TPA: hypothetical protein VFU22_15340 [Roseiflexaceae bacterium]|nr:hypothetical protein [Roseiflexaceae bacterium]